MGQGVPRPPPGSVIYQRTHKTQHVVVLMLWFFLQQWVKEQHNQKREKAYTVKSKGNQAQGS